MNTSEKTILKVLAVNDPAVDVYIDKKFGILDKYADDSVTVEFDIIPWDNYFATMLKAFNGEAPYDIVMVAGHLWLADFVQKQYLEPLSYDFEDIVTVISKEMQHNCKTYLSPSFCDGHMIVYRKSILEKVLGTLLKPVISADEFVNITQKLAEYGFAEPIVLKAHQSEILLDALPYLRSTGLDIYEIKENKVICNIDRMKNELEKYLKLKMFAPDNTNTFGNNEIKDMLVHKKAAMAVTWSGQLGVVAQECDDVEDLGFSTFDTAWNVTWSFGISKASKNKEKAAEFLAYLRSVQVDNLVGSYCGAPVRRSNYIDGLNEYPWYKVQLEMIEKHARPFIGILQAGDKNGILYDEIYQAFIGKKDAADAVKDAKSRIKALDERSSL